MPGRRTILVADDCKDDVTLLQRAFLKLGHNVQILCVCDGEEAIQYFSGENGYQDRNTFPLPRLLLLDIKMPKLDGFGFLDWLKKQPSLQELPVVMFSSSDQTSDVARAYRQGAASFLVKPGSLQDYSTLAGILFDYWMRANVPPPFVNP